MFFGNRMQHITLGLFYGHVLINKINNIGQSAKFSGLHLRIRLSAVLQFRVAGKLVIILCLSIIRYQLYKIYIGLVSHIIVTSINQSTLNVL